MGSGSSSMSTLLSAYDKDSIKSAMDNHKGEWGPLSQSELFRSIVPLEAVDFSGKFQSSGLDKFFTRPNLRTGEGFNCHHLYRSSQGETDMPIFSTDRYTVLQPLGEPGRDLPDGFQKSEFVLEHGFLDYIVERPQLKETLALSLKFFRS